MRRAILALLVVAVAGCAQREASAPAAAVTDASAGHDAPRGGSSPVPVLIGVAIGVGLILFLLSDEGGGGGAAFLPPV